MARPWIRRIGKAAVAIVVVVVAATEETAKSWIARFGKTAIATVVVAALALLWAIWWLWSLLAPQWDPRTIIAIAIVALALLAAIWGLWWQLPRREVRKPDVQIHDPKARADTEDNFRKTVGQALGGAAVLIGAVVAYLQFTQQQQATRDQLKASHDLLISNQVSKGFEQLASDKITERLGGIYALEGVMNTSDQYHQPVLEALCAFVRDSTTRQKSLLTVLLEAFTAPRDGTAGKDPDKPPNDIQAALTVIGRRGSGKGDVDLTAARIPKVYLRDANLSSANLPDANLSRADLENADFRGAYLYHSNLSDTDLESANLAGLELKPGLIRFTDLRGVNLSRADLSGANLSITTLTDADLHGADLGYADLREADLTGADLTGAHLTGANLSDAKLTQEQLDRAFCGKPKALPPDLNSDKLLPCPPRPK